MSRFVLTAQLQLQAPNNVAQVVRQIQSQLNNVNVNLNVQGSARAQRQLQQVTAQTQAATTAADRMGRAFAISIRRFAAFSIATRAVGLFTSTLADAVKQAIDFQREMVRVSQVTGETLGNLKFLAKGVTDLSTSLGVVSSDLLQAGQLLLQAGVSAKDTEVALKTLARAALAPNFDSLSETTEGAIAILAQFGEGVGALEKQLGAINAVAGAFAVEAGDLIDVIRRAGGVFKASGGDLNELIALFTSVRATTRESAESIGTGLRTIFTRIQRPKTIEFLKQFGVELVDMEGKFVGPYEAVRRLSSALAGLGEGDITFIRIAEELGGFRQIGKVLPLLQQFSTAQNALNVAQKAGNSLATDAATAQQALAIRILKVKEEFLALIRSMTETSTFQIMANTALSLASALIKIGEAIKPLLPLLAAVAAVNFARGIGTFAGGIMRGMQSGRTYSTGGKVHHFARGGMVPGTGNRDTVPAMLQPGEFVIKKSSVNKLGAGNLAAMNENKYAGGGNIAMKSASMALIGKRRLSVQEMLKAAKRSNYDLERLDNGKLQLSRNGKPYHTNLSDDEASELLASMATGYATGGKIQINPGAIGGFFLRPEKGQDRPVPLNFNGDISNPKVLKKLSLTDGKGLKDLRQDAFYNATKEQQAQILGLPLSSQTKKITEKNPIFDKNGKFVSRFRGALMNSGYSPSKDYDPNIAFQNLSKKTKSGKLQLSEKKPVNITGTLSSYFPGMDDLKTSSVSQIVAANTKKALGSAVIRSVEPIIQTLNNPVVALDKNLAKRGANRLANDANAQATTQGFIFEGLIQAITGAKLAGNQSSFDFPASSIGAARNSLRGMFTNVTGEGIDSLIKADAKRSNTRDAIDSIKSKIVNDINKGRLEGLSIQKFAKGGMAQAPLIDDIMNTTGALMPRPSSAIAALIRSGGGAIDIDRTIKRTMGDKAYGMAKTAGQQSAALDRFFRDPQARLRDIKSSPLTTFGKELQAAIKSGQLNPGRLSIITKSQRVPGVAEYINQLFGIPLANMIFTQGGSKQPAMDALRTKGPRASRVARFAFGGGVGTDTVPALLTPGEFVVNRSSAQSIGYGNLNRMNKVGKYAKGGVVQRFAAGTPMGGAKTSGGVSIPGFNTQPFGLLEKAILTLVTNFSSTAQISNKVQSKWAMLDKISPALAHALDGYISALKLSHKDALELTSAYNSLVNRLVKQKVSADEGTAALTPYIHALQAATKAHKNTAAAATPVPTSSPTVSPTLPRRQPGTQPVAPIQGPAPASTKQNTQAVAQNTKAQQSAAKSAMDVVNNNKMFAASMTVSMIQGFLPAIDENSGAVLKLTHSFLGFLTTIASVGFALEAFGVTIKKQALMDFFTGKGIGTDGIQKVFNLVRNMGGSKGLAGNIAGATQSVAKFAGPLIAAAGAAYLASEAFKKIAESIYNFDARLKLAIESGNVQEAKSIAEQKGTFEKGVGSAGQVAAATAAGAAIGSVVPVIGTAIGALTGFVVGLVSIIPNFDTTTDSAIALAAAQAGAVKTQKSLEKAQTTATRAMEDFEKGSISAADALAQIRAVSSEAVNQEKRAAEFATKNRQNRSEFGGPLGLLSALFEERGISGYMEQRSGDTIGNSIMTDVLGGAATRNTLALGGLNPFMETSWARNARLDKEGAEQINKATQFEAQRFQLEGAARSADIRSGLFKGESKEEVRNRVLGKGKENLEFRLQQQAELAKTLREQGNDAAATAAEESVKQLAEEINQVNREIRNLDKEIAIAKARFAALNLGLRSVTASADAAAMRMTNAMNSFDLSTVPAVNALNTLEASLTAAGQNISQAEFDAALGEVSGVLKKFGADAKQVTAFEDLAKGVAAVQREFPSMFDTLKDRLNSDELKKMSSQDIGNEFKKIIGETLEKSGIGDAAKQRIIDAMGDVKIEGDDLLKLRSGDLSVLEKYFGDAAEEVQKQIKEFGEKWITANQELIKATQERIEAERNLVAAQREAVDLYMEGREVQSKYGGRSLTIDERRSAVLAKSNIGAAQAGVGAMRTGSIAELRQRNAQILGGFSRIEGMKGKEGSAMGAEGAELQATQQDLQQAQKDQVQTIRDLIKLEEEELKIIQEKNRMERDSLESLISGDVDKFFAGQAASGAQAAIAAGDMRTANMFGAQAIADAFKDIQRQQEAGVQTMFGRQLGGPGGLAEQAAQASLASRGVMDPRMAQVLAGTTPEEEARRANLRDLGGVLGETGAVATAMAEMQVQTAQMKVEKAELIIANLNTGGVPVEGKAKGGLIYANRGMFVPRGTDTVPAMLTPGEFVVRREAVNRGNNLQLLKAINNNGASGAAFARGGKVGYYNSGGKVQYKAGGGILGNIGGALGIDPQLVTTLANTFTNFVTKFNDSIKNLQNTKLQIKMDSVNVNVNLNASTMLNQISQEAKTEIMRQVITKIQQEYSVGPNGKLTENKSNLPR